METSSPQGTLAPDARPARPRVLVVDDHTAERRMLRRLIEGWGYDVTEAADGAEALALSRTTAFDLVLCDWIMPGLSGPEVCAGFRALPRQAYGYFLMLTSKSTPDEIAAGLEGGADDYLTKPVRPQELRARLLAGRRIVEMERALAEKNRIVSQTLDRLSTLYDALERDLVQARRLQQSLLRERERSFGATTVSLLLEPAGHVGGDLVGVIEAGPGRLLLYALDVAGHGVTAALTSARLAALIAGGGPGQNMALTRGPDGTPCPRTPASVAADLDTLLQAEIEGDTYFTLFLGDFDLQTGHLRFVQAGHPHPMILRADGTIERLGQGGLPVGLVQGARFETAEAQLHPGDRLLVVSDGVTEHTDPQARQLGEEGLSGLMQRHRSLRAWPFLEALASGLAAHGAGQALEDDASALCLDYGGPV